MYHAVCQAVGKCVTFNFSKIFMTAVGRSLMKTETKELVFVPDDTFYKRGVSPALLITKTYALTMMLHCSTQLS